MGINRAGRTYNSVVEHLPRLHNMLIGSISSKGKKEGKEVKIIINKIALCVQVIFPTFPVL